VNLLRLDANRTLYKVESIVSKYPKVVHALYGQGDGARVCPLIDVLMHCQHARLCKMKEKAV
jgi:hypothetical protein